MTFLRRLRLSSRSSMRQHLQPAYLDVRKVDRARAPRGEAVSEELAKSRLRCCGAGSWVSSGFRTDVGDDKAADRRAQRPRRDGVRPPPPRISKQGSTQATRPGLGYASRMQLMSMMTIRFALDARTRCDYAWIDSISRLREHHGSRTQQTDFLDVASFRGR